MVKRILLALRGVAIFVIDPANWRWYRRTCGGHWERVHVEPVCGSMWFRQDHDKAATMALRRYGHIEQLLECEQW